MLSQSYVVYLIVGASECNKLTTTCVISCVIQWHKFLASAHALTLFTLMQKAPLSLSYHVRNICKDCFVYIMDLKRVTGYLSHDFALLTANALVGSTLTTVIPCLGCSSLDLCKLQISRVKKTLHWLPIKCRSVVLSQPYWSTSYYNVSIQTTLNVSLNLDIVSTTLKQVNLMVYCLRSHTMNKFTKYFGLSFTYDVPKI